MNIYHNKQYPRRGEIYYVKKGDTLSTGSETWSNRHAVIVSANHNNKHSHVVQVVYITTQSKSNSPTHVDISTQSISRTVLCEQIIPVDKSRIVEYKGSLTPEQMRRVDMGLAFHLNLLKYNSDNNQTGFDFSI